ncbi:origin recognition complex subunit 2 [Copidosoma floridanum]|uniref:origin recognition complex subunit 2 n=1 Tax=Copidosoma floridanum TaxID=29053 RepID=UPI0006C96BA6|nr:origin recognition complex subunit 2 [Copidosoma floridanum]
MPNKRGKKTVSKKKTEDVIVRRSARNKATVNYNCMDSDDFEKLSVCDEEDFELQFHENDDFQDVEKQPTALFVEGEVEGKKICPIPDYRGINKNSMIEAAKKLSEHENKGKKVSKVKASKVKKKLTVSEKEKKNPVNKENEQVIENVKKQSAPIRITRRTGKATEYLMDSENYFAIQSEKSVTSNNTLSKLKKQDEKQLQDLLKVSNHVPEVYKNIIKANYDSLKMGYIEWIQIMEEGFNILLYGFGSKRSLINDFFKEIIPDEPTLIINGFFPNLTIKEILDDIIVELLGLNTAPSQNECYDIIKRTMNSYPNERIYLLIHNIDGEILRTQKTQEMLCRLANIPNVHVLASIDHINAPLIWDNVMRAKFNFYWVEARTYLPYEAETSYESSLLIQKNSGLALLSMKNIFASLTTNAKKIFMTVIRYQLENSGLNYSGMTFKDLLTASRENFSASSDQVLRAQLTEFVDHKLVKFKRNLDGAECLIIPLDNAILKQLQEQYSSIQ